METLRPVDLTWTPEIEDLADLLRASNAAVRHRRRNVRTWWSLTLFVLPLVVGYAVILRGIHGQPVYVVLGIALIVAGFGWAVSQGGFVAPVKNENAIAAANFKAHEALRAPKLATIGAAGFDVRGAAGPWTHDWVAVHHVAETERSFIVAVASDGGKSWVGLALYLLLTGSRPYEAMPLPKRGLAEPGDLDRLRALFMTHVPPGKLRLL